MAAFFTIVLLYLAAVGALRDDFLRIAEEQTFQYVLPPGPAGGRQTFRITFRIKTGEIIIYREEAEIHNIAPQNLIN